MDWSLAIDLNRKVLLRFAAGLVASAGTVADGTDRTVPRHLHTSMFRVLRPAEAALRRLIVVVVFVMRLDGRSAPKRAARTAPARTISRKQGDRVPPFALFDPRKRPASASRRRYAAHAPNMSFFGGSDDRSVQPEAPAPSPDDPVNAAHLLRRIEAMIHALKDLPKQARRLARIQARRAKAGKRVLRPMRPGRPPGHRARGKQEVDDVLRECHILALMALVPPDTS